MISEVQYKKISSKLDNFLIETLKIVRRKHAQPSSIDDAYNAHENLKLVHIKTCTLNFTHAAWVYCCANTHARKINAGKTLSVKHFIAMQTNITS